MKEKMKLKLWIVEQKTNVKEFAQRIGCCRSYLSSIISGNLRIGLELAEKIEKETNGAITRKYLRKE